MRTKPVVAMDLSTTGKGGGPYTSTQRIIHSNLRIKYDFQILSYKTELGRFISLRRIRDLINQLRILNPDIVHFTGLQLSGFHIALACMLAGIKNTVVTVRGFSSDMISLHPLKKLMVSFIFEPLTLFLSKIIYGNSEYVISRKLIKIYGYKCHGAIYNFPPIPFKTNGSNDIRNELGISTDDKIAVSVARINKEKGYHILEEAIKKFTDKKNLKFIIVGKGDYLQEMQTSLKDQVDSGQVFFLGYRSDVQRILSGCNFFILPTLHETLSVALLEASVEGLALIASDTGGVPEIVEDGYNGLLVTPLDVNALQSAIKNIYENDKLREQFGSNARVKIDDKFSSETIEARIDNAYQNLLFNLVK